MKPKALAIKLALFSTLAFLSPSLAQQPPQNEQQQPNQQAGQADPNAPEEQSVDLGVGLHWEQLENFEEAEDWIARATCPLGETKILKIVQRGEIRSADDEHERPPPGEAYSINQNAQNPNHILGVKTYFEDRGFDRVEISPPHEFIIRGKARQFSVWVLGRNFRHTMFIKLRDYRGRIHKLRLGRLDFFGWRRLTVTVPGWLPQSTRFALLDRNLHFVSLFVVSDHHEVGGTFYFYVDGLKVLVDRSEQDYPGAEIKDNW